jgi:gliding motility-associated-like protein
VGRDTVIVRVDSSGTGECDTLVVYDVFSPNGDGTNDQWIVDGLDAYPDNELQIFNRWGNVVFEAKPYLNDWDGESDKGEPLPSATYYYILKLYSVDKATYSGSVTLVR